MYILYLHNVFMYDILHICHLDGNVWNDWYVIRDRSKRGKKCNI